MKRNLQSKNHRHNLGATYQLRFWCKVSWAIWVLHDDLLDY